MIEFVIDSSAVLADLRGEPGGAVARELTGASAISAVNLSEVIAKLIELGADVEAAEGLSAQLEYEVLDADQARAKRAGRLHSRTQKRGVSLGDRFCIALAEELNLPLITADRHWQALDLSVEVRLIR